MKPDEIAALKVAEQRRREAHDELTVALDALDRSERGSDRWMDARDALEDAARKLFERGTE